MHITTETEAADPISRAALEHFRVSWLYPYQRLVISNILEGRNQIVILPTGAGKSLCFQVPSVLLPGTTLVVFPLLSLMADQERRLKEAGLDPGILKGGQEDEERRQLWARVRAGSCRFIIANPEILLTPRILSRLEELRISHLVVDETHTVSEWGESFRPSYLRMAEIVEAAGFPLVTAFTATASPAILEKVKFYVFGGEAVHIVAGNPDRPNITYAVLPTMSKNHSLTELAATMERPLIIFHRSRPGAELTSRMLRIRLKSEDVFFYHAKLTKEEKKRVESWFFPSKTGILCATCAYGLGVDKPDIRGVIHRDVPPSVESYLQESGRAGRDKLPSQAVLLFASEDIKHLLKLNDPLLRERYRIMLDYCGNTDKCRRETLLEALNAVPENCFGCDVCSGKTVTNAAGTHELMTFVRQNRRRFTLREARVILSGAENFEAKDRGLWRSPWFGRLSSWHGDDLDEAFADLMEARMIRLPEKGMFKDRLI